MRTSAPCANRPLGELWLTSHDESLDALDPNQILEIVMPGVPPDVVKRLKDTRALATKMSSTRARALGDGVW